MPVFKPFLRRTLWLGLVLAIVVPAAALAQDIGLGFGRLVSPGDLAKSHGEFDSITRCVECHDLQGGVNEEKCLDCHKQIRVSVNYVKGYHGHLTVRNKKCVECHKDHKGKSFDMVVGSWPGGRKDAFDHRLVDFALADKHATAKCDKCHDKKTEKGNSTYLGLSADCVSCHKDVHEKSLGARCQECHANARSFVGQDVTFDHDAKSKYKLVGAHEKTGCQKCHKGNTKERALFKVEKYDTCVACHKKDDKHKGALGEKCEKCHTAEDWKKLTNFDHDTAKYRLTGKHATAKCFSCHVGADKSGNFKVAAYKSCAEEAACHGAARNGAGIHGAQFGGRGCDQCHTEKGWKDETFSHNGDRYKVWRLKGKHADTPCDKCHRPTGKMAPYDGGKPVIGYTGLPKEPCAASGCHSPASKSGATHGDQFKGEPCEKCHTEQGWKPATFKHDDPRYTGFKLLGKHATERCDACHRADKGGRVIWRPLDSRRCDNAGCHDVEKRGAIHGAQFAGKDCAECHTEKGWEPTTFVHDRSPYKLHGKHQQVKCAKCHKPTPDGAVTAYDGERERRILYRPIDTKSCAAKGCHADEHKGLFGKKECAECHVVAGWKDMSATFDHGLDTHFRLTGKHRLTDCAKCHVKGSDGKAKWKPLPVDCLGCHKRDDKHKGSYGEKCANCHSAASWSPIPAAHDNTAFPLKGTHKQLICVDCHKKGNGDFSGLSPDCSQCHTDPHLNQFGRLCGDCHTESNWDPTQFVHAMTGFRLEGGHRFADCRACHVGRYYRTLDSQCLSCHLKDYGRGAAFHSHSQLDCESCHSVYNFAPAKQFAHKTMTFTGTHAVIQRECASCHVTSGSNQYAPRFPGASVERDCFSCHQANYLRAHPAGWPTDCSLCHSTVGFSPVKSGRVR
ncbi:MAG: hypothetical protein HQK87_02250 [Nitrospinae bacterium]|nr:hypothetical protein [Nitrospinota bacterium]